MPNLKNRQHRGEGSQSPAPLPVRVGEAPGGLPAWVSFHGVAHPIVQVDVVEETMDVILGVERVIRTRFMARLGDDGSVGSLKNHLTSSWYLSDWSESRTDPR